MIKKHHSGPLRSRFKGGRDHSIRTLKGIFNEISNYDQGSIPNIGLIPLLFSESLKTLDKQNTLIDTMIASPKEVWAVRRDSVVAKPQSEVERSNALFYSQSS